MAVIKLSVHKIVRDEDWFRWSNETNNDISVIKIVKPAISLSLTQSAQTVKCIRIVKLAVKHLEFLHAPLIIDRKLLEILDERIRFFERESFLKWNISSDRYEFLEEAAFSTGIYLGVYIIYHVASAQRLYMTLQSFVNSDIRWRGLDGPQLNLPSQRVTCALVRGIPHLRSDNHVGNNVIPVLQHGIRGEQEGQPVVILTALAWTCIVCWIWTNRQTR